MQRNEGQWDQSCFEQIIFMKPVYYLIALLSVAAFDSCKKDNLAYSSDYASSLHKWKVFKDSSHNSYRYEVSYGSWTGHSAKTIITVRNGKVVGRSYLSKQVTHTPTGIVTKIFEEWTETESQLSTHQSGADLVTLDVIYEKAKNDWLRKRSDATTYFEARNNGMLSLAGYVPNGCQDDCLNGITINFIEAI
jgi:hypothetical protein